MSEPATIDPPTDADWMGAVRIDPMLHFVTCAKIKKKDGKVEYPDAPNTLQGRMFAAYTFLQVNGLPINIIVLKPRQSGGSEGTAELCWHHSRRFNMGGFMMADQHDRTSKIWKLFTQKGEPGMDDFGPYWGNAFKANTEHAVIKYTDERGMKCEAVWDRGTANDSAAGASGTRQIIWLSESARYAKDGAFKDSDVIGNALNSIPPDLANTMRIAESTAEGCYDDQTEVLTDEGWKYFADLSGSEHILSKRLKTGVAYYESQWGKVVHAWNGPMICLDARSVNLKVTPDHMMWLARQRAKFRFQPASSMLKCVTDFNFDRAMIWETNGMDEFVLPEYTYAVGSGFTTRPAKAIPMEVWLPFLGHWLSDGAVSVQNRSVSLTQSKFVEKFRKSARDVADALGFNMREADHTSPLPNAAPAIRFIIENTQLVDYLDQYAQPKRIPRDLLMGLSAQQCRVLLDAIYEGDGDQEHRTRETAQCEYGKIYAGVDKELQDDIQELALKCGYASTVYGPERNRIATFTEVTVSHLSHRNPPTVEHYEGNVYCVSLPHDHLVMVRRNGIALWCGNSIGWHKETFDRAVYLHERMAGKVGNGWIRVFMAWHECDDYMLKDLPQNAEFFDDTNPEWVQFVEEEEAGRIRYGWTPEQIAWRRKKIVSDLGGDVRLFKRDYPASPEEAWSSSGSKQFSVIAVAHMLAAAKTSWDATMKGLPGAPRLGTLQGNPFDLKDSAQWLPAKEGAWLWCAEEPKLGRKYSVIVDPMTGEQSAGSDKRDNHGVLVKRDAYADEKGVVYPDAIVAAIYQPSGCQWNMDILADRVTLLSRWYGKCIVINEVNKAMDLVPLLQQRGVLLYRRRGRPDNVNPSERQLIVGFETNTSTRAMWVTAGTEAIREGKLECLFLPAVQEMDTFIVNPRGKAEASPGTHDDFVAAYCIAALTKGCSTLMALPVVRTMNHGQMSQRLPAHHSRLGSGAIS